MLNEISGDLRQRVQHIKVVLGEDEDDELEEGAEVETSGGITAEDLALPEINSAPNSSRVRPFKKFH